MNGTWKNLLVMSTIVMWMTRLITIRWLALHRKKLTKAVRLIQILFLWLMKYYVNRITYVSSIDFACILFTLLVMLVVHEIS